MVSAQLMVHDAGREILLDISSNGLAMLIELLPDEADLGEAYGRLAGHADCSVRTSVASKKYLPAAAIHILATDPALCVAKELVTTPEICRQLDSHEVLTLCQRDPDLAVLVAARFEDFALGDSDVINFLEAHPDSQVREALAGNPFVPKAVLQRLALRDPDASVRQTAAEILL
jgi:hypothetical protein